MKLRGVLIAFAVAAPLACLAQVRRWLQQLSLH
jgi:hypothetical protein